MNYKVVLLEDLAKGYSKSDLEKLIGLPKNNLSGILKGDRNLSKKSKLKIEKWMASVKPDPLSLFFEQPSKKPTLPNSNIEFKTATKSSYNGTKNSRIKRDEDGQIIAPDEPPRLKGESSIEYRLRMIELSETKKKHQ